MKNGDRDQKVPAGIGFRIYREKLEAFRYINEKECGTLEELRTRIGESLTNEFISLGFIHTGYTLEEETWGINPLGKIYYEIIK